MTIESGERVLLEGSSGGGKSTLAALLVGLRTPETGGDLLERMPSGLMQMVGETGWQLSHGERSRVYLARALLQNAQLTVLDESFAALDLETLKRCLDCAVKRARMLLVIAHP